MSQHPGTPALPILSLERNQFTVVLGGELVSYQTFLESYSNFVLVGIEVLIRGGNSQDVLGKDMVAGIIIQAGLIGIEADPKAVSLKRSFAYVLLLEHDRTGLGQAGVYAWGDYFYLVWQEQHPPDWIWGICYIFGAWYLPGDVDYSDEVNVADLTYLVDYLFFGGDGPFVPDAAEMNGEHGVNVADLTYLVDYLFFGGPPPVGGMTGL